MNFLYLNQLFGSMLQIKNKQNTENKQNPKKGVTTLGTALPLRDKKKIPVIYLFTYSMHEEGFSFHNHSHCYY